jgi:hypothetical protein
MSELDANLFASAMTDDNAAPRDKLTGLAMIRPQVWSQRRHDKSDTVSVSISLPEALSAALSNDQQLVIDIEPSD